MAYVCVTNPIITNLIALLNQICALKESGANIVHVPLPQELRWTWVNLDTEEKIGSVRLSEIKMLSSSRHNDPRINYLINFAAGGHAIEARNAINKLENLKVFW